MADEYDFSKAIRGLTARRYASGSNVVVSPARKSPGRAGSKTRKRA